MSSVKGLDNAMMREEPTKAHDERVVEAFNKLGTHTNGDAPWFMIGLAALINC